LWLIYAVGAFTIVYAVFLRPMMKQKKDPLSRPPGSSLARQRSVERQMETLLVELSEMARQITAQLDTRAAKLEALLKEADEKIAGLQARKLPDDPPTPADFGKLPSGLSVRVEGIRAAAGRDVAPMVEDTRHADVYELADAGMSATQISQRLSRPRGEVELILALRTRRASGADERIDVLR
jgi:hypothetical protein